MKILLKKINLILLINLLAVFTFAGEPRQIAKGAQVEVPPDMHLVTDRTGARWLLPLDMDTPPEREVVIAYYKAKKEPQLLYKIGTHRVLDTALSSEDTVVSTDKEDSRNLMRKIPQAFAEVLYLEKAANMHANNSRDLQSLGLFGPAQFTTFKVPYIPMPVSEFEFAKISNYAAKQTRELLEFQKEGVPYIRFFIHPNYVKSYEDLIGKFGIVYHYEGITSSSPRSLIVIDPDDSAKVHWIKVSLHKKLDGSVRINTDKKARRAIIMSEAINEVPKDVMESYKLSFMLEPAAFQPKWKIASTIHREVDPELLHPAPGTRWIPAFILQNTGDDAVPELNLKDMIHLSGMTPEKFVDQKIIRPLLFSYLNMGIREGLPGELHTQNFYYKLVKVKNGWLPTGEVKFKDNDGFRYDTELALRQKRGMRFFSEFDEPFFWGKFSNTLGLGPEGIPFLGSWYYKLIRNVNGFETLSAYMLRALQKIETEGNWTKERIQLLFDDIAAQEAKKITGVQIDSSDYGYAKDKGLNKILNIYRTRLSGEADTAQRYDEELQKELAEEWRRLREESRASALRRTVGKDTYYLLHVMSDGAMVIEARTPKTSIKNPDPTIGFAVLESQNTLIGRQKEDHFKNILEKKGFWRGPGGRCENVL
ncbi:MAG: hypothetical protein AAGB31_12255 [Bdellovibrio sp.]